MPRLKGLLMEAFQSGVPSGMVNVCQSESLFDLGTTSRDLSRKIYFVARTCAGVKRLPSIPSAFPIVSREDTAVAEYLKQAVLEL